MHNLKHVNAQSLHRFRPYMGIYWSEYIALYSGILYAVALHAHVSNYAWAAHINDQNIYYIDQTIILKLNKNRTCSKSHNIADV